MSAKTGPTLTDGDYRRLLAFRDTLRVFLRWSEERAAEIGLTPAQHQLLLAIRGHGGDEPPSVGDVAHHLQLRHHSAVELVDRAEKAGLVRRTTDEADHRLVRLELTTTGARRLRALSARHLDELERLGAIAVPVWDDLASLALGDRA